MLKNFAIGSRILLGSVLILLLTLGGLLPVQIGKLSALATENQICVARGLFQTFETTLKDQANLALALASAMANRPEVQRAFAEGDREALLALTEAQFTRLEEEQNVRQIQFLTPPATSFLRVHMPSKHGDDLRDMRGTVVAANQTRKPVMGLEGDVADLGMRGVYPLSYQGQHLGVVEFGISFGQPFFDAFLEDFEIPSALHLVKGRGFETFAGTIAEGTLLSPEELLGALNGDIVTRPAYLDKKPVLIYAQAVTDYSGQPIGVAELLLDRAASDYRETMAAQFGIGAFMLIIGFAIAFGIRRSITRPLRAMTARLHEIAAGDGDLTQRMDAEGRNELADLARAFNAFIDKVQTQVRAGDERHR